MQITGGYLKSRKILSPRTSNVRPTLSQVRESIFSVLFSMMDFEGKKFLDAFAGSGIMGFEAMSRGFGSVSFIEKDKKTYFLLKDNAKKLDIEAQFFFGDTTKVLNGCNQCFDVIYIDPPYQSGLYDRVLELIKENALINHDGIVILEHPSALEIECDGFTLIKQKKYADKAVSFLELCE